MFEKVRIEYKLTLFINKINQSMRKKLLNLCLTALLSVVSTAAWALSEVNGFYQIGSAADYAEFAALVNGGEKKANAILTADIDLGSDIDLYKIGVPNGEYDGVFDGAGHTITIDFPDCSLDNQGPALFRSLGHYAVVKRLKVQGTITTARQHAAAIANFTGGIIRDCWADVTINVTTTMSDGSGAAIAGQCNKCSVIENCLAKVIIDAPDSHKFGGVAAWSDAQRTHFANNLVLNEGNFEMADGKSAGLVRNDDNLAIVNLSTYNANSYTNRPQGASVNNYVTNDFGFLNKGTTIVTDEELASGKICYQLNSDQSQIRWKQILGTDAYPVPAVFCGEAGQVYASAATDCQGKATGDVTYSNSGSVTATSHTYDKWGICTTCGEFNWNCFDFDDPTRYDPTDKSFLISSGDDLFLAEGWNRLQNGGLFNLKLTNDVECKPDPGQLIFNNSDWIESSFNGQGHTLTIEMVDITDDYPCLFPRPYAYRGDFVVENLVMHGKISSIRTSDNGSYAHVASLTGWSYGGNKKIHRNVYSDVEIDVAYIGDATTGGLAAVPQGTNIFENCIYAGSINGVEGTEAVAGLVGWSNASITYNNCAFLGTLNNVSGDTHTIARNYNNGTFNNIYSVNTYGDGADESKFTVTTPEAVESGELAFLLNDKQSGLERFYQLIGTDPTPMPIAKEGALVYAITGSYRCDGQPLGDDVTYGNSSSAVIPDHQFADGFCTVCGKQVEDYMTPVDGWYEIGTPAQLMWWAHYAAKKDLGASAKLTADIDMEEYNSTYPDRSYPQIGTEAAPFYGNFDGQYHTISNLNINLPGCRGAGLISVMSSQPDNTLGGLSEDNARAAEGVFVKNVVLDNSTILGQGYTGVVGMAANWAGHITISGVLNMGSATVDGGTNCSGLFGCAMGSKSHMTITNCGFIGDVHVLNDTHTENGLFSGWLGQYAEVTNCFALGTIDSYPDPARSWARHPNYNTCVIKNCYALEGSTNVQETGYDNNPEDVTFLPAEEVTNGALAWKANGKQFRNPAWYQTVGTDENPFPIPTHGTVIYGAEQYFSALTDADIETIAPVIQNYEDGVYDAAAETTLATQSLLDEWKATVEVMTDSTTIASFANAFDDLETIKAEVEANAAVYQSYIDKCAEILAFLENDKTFEGSLRSALEYYLSDDIADEPDDNNPLGTYGYILENHVATAEEIQAEIARLEQWLQDAIAEDYKPGTDVSKLIPNSDFAQKNTEHWTGAWCNAYGEVPNTQTGNGTVVGVEAWNRTGDMFQTVEGMKPGYYLVGVSGAFRPSNNRYSTNYASGIYANGIFNYFPTVVEEYIAAADTIDQENCNLHGAGALDLPIYDDFMSEDDAQALANGATLLGFAVHGQVGMAAAANAGRHQVYTVAKVGEDGKLTIGIKNPGTHYSNDWTGWGPIKVTYFGNEDEQAGAGLDQVLENMGKRAQTIINYTIDDDIKDPAANPNFPAELKDSLQEVLDAVDGAETVEAKLVLAQRFSDLFQKVYEGKQAYISLFNYANSLDIFEGNNLPLVEKDEETGEWYETGDYVFSKAETDSIFNATTDMLNGFFYGTFSTEQALNPTTVMSDGAAEVIANIVPKQDEDGYYLIANPKQFVAYRALFLEKDHGIKAKLVDDIDMIGIGMQPFGNNTEGTNDSGINYTGTLDGQGHALENVYINFYSGRGCALFFDLENATIKNLKLTGEYYGGMQRMGGLSRYTSGSTKIENCEIAVTLHNEIEGDATTGGIMGVCRGGGSVVVDNCLVNCTFIGENAHSVGGVCGWKDGAATSLTVMNTLILSQYNLAPEPESYPSDLVSRNGCTVSNTYFAERSVIEGAGVRGTMVSEEQLASGEITYKLNSGVTQNPAWFQTLGTDETPRLFSGKIVYFRNGMYMNRVLGDVDFDGKVDGIDAQAILNVMSDDGYNVDCDVDGDGKVDGLDYQTVLNIMSDM